MRTLLLSTCAILCSAFPGTAVSVYAALQTPVEVVSITVDPEAPQAGTHPSISARIRATKAAEPQGHTAVTVIAVLVLPNNSVRSWTWKNISLGREETREFSLPKDYDISLAGRYKVEINIYSADMRRRLAARSTGFSVASPAQTGERKPSPVPAAERPTLGIGIYGNVFNPAGGGTVLLWPFERVGLQGSYTIGRFTTTEARLLVKFDRVAGVAPYVGAGYLNVSKESDVIGISTTFKDSGISGVAGVEVPLGRKLFGYVEVSGAAVDLEEIVTNGSQTVKATVEYAPVTIGIGIVYYLF
jgi:hypothetical protein